MLQPTAEQLASLTRTERLIYHFADFCNRRLKRVLMVWNYWFTISFVNLSTGRRIRIDGIKNLQDFKKSDRVILVSNHRSFFDFYVISWVTYRLTNMGRRSIFPVRSTFFYEGILGALVNLVIGGMAMFPPIMRSKEKRTFNQFALNRVKDELSIPETVVGMHPEGTRKKDDNAYTFLKTRPGVGQLAICAKGVTVIPIFVNGLSNRIIQEMKQNFFAVKGNEIDIVIGAPISFEDFKGREEDRQAHIEAAERCMKEIAHLGERQKDIANARLLINPT